MASDIHDGWTRAGCAALGRLPARTYLSRAWQERLAREAKRRGPSQAGGDDDRLEEERPDAAGRPEA
eukprot:8446341-Alexandrium_andersonii.AAC.1